MDYQAIHTSQSPIGRGFAPDFVEYKNGCTRLATASDKAYQLLVHGRWFSSGTPASSTTKTGHHDIAEILLKVTLTTINQIKYTYYELCIVHLLQDHMLKYFPTEHFGFYSDFKHSWKGCRQIKKNT